MKLIYCSPPRSGSTLVHNILKHILKKPNLVKTHNCNNYNSKDKYIITIRNPYNSIVSAILAFDQELTIPNLKKYRNIWVNFAKTFLSKNLLNKKNVLILYYEDFHNDFDYIFTKLEQFLNIIVDDKLRHSINMKFNKDSVKKIIKKYNTFKSRDAITDFHGRHISIYNGMTNYIDIIDKQCIEYLHKDEFLKKYNKYFFD